MKHSKISFSLRRLFLLEFLLLIVTFCNLTSCRKSNNATSIPQGTTFFKVYNTPTGFLAGPNSTQFSSGAIICDDTGNLYVWYFDSCIIRHSTANFSGSLNRIALIKTDKNGTTIWNKRYFAFTPGFQYGTDYHFSGNFVRIGQTLYLAGQDSVGNFVILKFSTNGQYAGQIPLNGYIPTGINGSVNKLLVTKEGNLLVLLTYRYSPPYYAVTKPVIALLDPSGALLWANDNFAFPVVDSFAADYEIPDNIVENNDGSFMVVTTGNKYSNVLGSGESITSDTRQIYSNFYHISNQGVTQSFHSFSGGTVKEDYNADVFQLYNCPGAYGHAAIFNAPDGYLLAYDYQYDEFSDCYIKLVRIDTAANITDSSVINTVGGSSGTLKITDAVQRKDGSILISASNKEDSKDVIYLSWLYFIDPSLGIQNIKDKNIGVKTESYYISGIAITPDGGTVLTGLFQTFTKDANNLFILKMDKNENY